MTETYTPPSISNFNDNPPDDDGTVASSNLVEWAKHIDEIGTPLKTYADAINSATETAFDNILANNLAISVKDPRYGAAGDGVTDDSTAINAAISAASAISGATVYFPPGEYLCSSTLDCTDNDGLVLQGASRGSFSSKGGTTLLLDSGGIGIDGSGSDYFTVRDMYITSDDAAISTPSTCGILLARSTANEYASTNLIDNVQMVMHVNAAANGGYGVIGIYNLRSEISTVKRVHVTADIPIVYAGDNTIGLTSAITGHGAVTSNVVHNINDGASFVSTKNGPAILFDNVGSVHAHSFWCSATAAAPGSYEYAIKMIGTGNSMLQLEGTIEGASFDHCIDNQTLWQGGKCDLVYAVGASSDPLISIAANKTIEDLSILRIYDPNGGATAVELVNGPGTAGIHSCYIMLGVSQTLDTTLVWQNLKIETNSLLGSIGSGGNRAPSSAVDMLGSVGGNILYQASDVNLDATHFHVYLDATAAPRTANLPAASSCVGRMYIVGKADVSGNAVTLTPNGADTVIGTASITSSSNVMRVHSDGVSVWWPW